MRGFRPDELIEPSLSRIISPVGNPGVPGGPPRGRGARRHAQRSAQRTQREGEVIPTTLNASALRDPDGNVIGTIAILREMRELDKARDHVRA